MSIEWTRLYYIILYFIIYSIDGWILESIYKSIGNKKIINSGFLYGPYCPIYGFGTMIMIAFLYRLKDNIFLLFIVSFIVLSVWEYLVALYLEKEYHTKYWDYSSRRLNINGRVCLLNSIYWGILGVIFTEVLHPYIIHKINLLSLNTIKYIDIIMTILMTVDFVITSINNKSILRRLETIKELNNTIKEKLEELKNENIPQEAKNYIIEKLQLRYNKMKFKLYRQLVRMKRAFPTMQSETINSFLNQEIETKELKQKIKDIKNMLKIKQD